MHVFLQMHSYGDLFMDQHSKRLNRTYQLGVKDDINLQDGYNPETYAKAVAAKPSFVQGYNMEGDRDLAFDIPVPSGFRIVWTTEEGVWAVTNDSYLDQKVRLYCFRFQQIPDSDLTKSPGD